MSATGDARAALTVTLEGLGYPVKDHPSKANNWTVVLGSVDPQMVQAATGKGPTFDATAFDYSLYLHCIGGNPQNSLAKLEDMVENIVFNLGDWNIDDWSAPFPGDSGDNKVFLTVTLQISKTIYIEGGN